MGVRLYLIIALICISMMFSELSIFSCAYWPFIYMFFGEMSIQVFCPFLNQLVCFLLLSVRSSLYMQDTNLLSDV